MLPSRIILLIYISKSLLTHPLSRSCFHPLAVSHSHRRGVAHFDPESQLAEGVVHGVQGSAHHSLSSSETLSVTPLNQMICFCVIRGCSDLFMHTCMHVCILENNQSLDK